MNNEQLSSIIEKLALEVVLIDHTEIDEMGDIVELFTQIVNWAEDNSQTILLHAASECAAIMTKLIAQSDPSPEESFSFITSAISEIQSHARNEFNFMAMVLPAIPGIKVPETENSNVKTSPAPDKIGLRHPTTLPGHLDNELFAEFLALQTGNLDKMEALILSIEEQSDESSIIELKRMIHTIKGEAGFLNLGEIETLCHLTEDILGDKSPSQYTDIFLSTIDWMRKAFTWYSGGDSEPEPAAPLIEIIKSCHWDTNKKAPEDTKEEVRTDVNNIEKKISETLTNNLSELSHNTDFYSKFISRIENSIGSSEKFIDKLLPMIDNLQISDNRPSNELQQGILKLQ